MKRIVILLSALIFLLTACSESYTATDLLAKLLTLPIKRDAVICFGGADLEGEGYLSKEKADHLYSNQDPVALAEDFALALGKDDAIFEIHLYLALDGASADAIEVILAKRQSMLQRKENELYSDGVSVEVILWRKGRWIALLATEDNAAVKNVLNKML